MQMSNAVSGRLRKQQNRIKAGTIVREWRIDSSEFRPFIYFAISVGVVPTLSHLDI